MTTTALEDKAPPPAHDGSSSRREGASLPRLSSLVSSVERAILARGALEATVLGATVLGSASLVCALALPELPRWPWLALLPVAPIVGAWRARRTLPSESDLVLFIDRKLEGGEAILSAYELDEAQRAQPLFAGTVASAHGLLEKASASAVRPRVVRGDAWALLVAVGTFVAASVVPVPPPRRPDAGTDTVQTTETEELVRIERLPERVTDEVERRQLEEAAREARELREALAEGTERREALDRVEALRDALENAQDAQAARETRAQEDAAEALAEQTEMAEAVRQRDLEALARAAERSAAQRESADRERARQALEDAARAAREAGDEELAESLLESAELLQRRAEQAELARELAESMPELAAGLGAGLDRLSRDGDGDRKSTRLNSSHRYISRMPSSA
jgi:hypothetical protein